MPEPAPPLIARAVERWFGRHARLLPWRLRYDPYEVWVSEVMAQQTRMSVVVPYFERFIGHFPDLQSLASATFDEVATLWSGLGYYRRAAMLHRGAQQVVDRFGGRLPSEVSELLSIPGIGRYTAGAIASIAFDERAPIVDGNVRRVLTRLAGADGDCWERAEALVEVCKSPRQFNQGLMELGAEICTPRNAACNRCPVAPHCVAYAEGTVDQLPSPPRREAPRIMSVPIYVITDGEGRYLLRREDGPLMRGLFHLPHGDRSLLTAKPLRPACAKRIATFRHTITSRRIEFVVHAVSSRRRPKPPSIRDGDADHVWVSAADLETVPHPSYVAKALQLARNWMSRETSELSNEKSRRSSHDPRRVGRRRRHAAVHDRQ